MDEKEMAIKREAVKRQFLRDVYSAKREAKERVLRNEEKAKERIHLAQAARVEEAKRGYLMRV